MIDFETHTIETAPDAAKPILQSALKGYGFVPNLYAAMAQAPTILEGYMSLSAIFSKTDLSETERQIILMTNNRLNGCKYCMAAHTTLSQMAGVADDIVDALRNDTAIADTKLEAFRLHSAPCVQVCNTAVTSIDAEPDAVRNASRRTRNRRLLCPSAVSMARQRPDKTSGNCPRCARIAAVHIAAE